MDAWNEISHININDLLFALGLRGRRRSGQRFLGNKSARVKGESGGVQHEGALQADGQGDRHQPAQPCKTETCLQRDQLLEEVVDKRVAVQEASIKARKRKAAMSSKAAVSKASRDEKQDELDDLANSLQSGESTWQSLRDTLSAIKAQYAALEGVMHDVLADRARHKREEAVDSMPPHLRRSLPSGLAEARSGLIFSSPPSRLAKNSSRSKTVFAILEDGMPGGRLETRQRSSSVGSPPVQVSSSVSSPNFDQENFGVWPTTPPRCRLGTGSEFPPLQLAVSPIQSNSSVGGVIALDEENTSTRRNRQKARLRRRAEEWWKAGGGVSDGDADGNHDHHRNHRQPRSATANIAGVGRRRSAWASPQSGASASPLRIPLLQASPLQSRHGIK
ncbi:unnamed protein product [Pylaiella littoralis]